MLLGNADMLIQMASAGAGRTGAGRGSAGMSPGMMGGGMGGGGGMPDLSSMVLSGIMP